MAQQGPLDIRVDGDRLRIVQREIRNLGPDQELKKALLKGLNSATKPLREKALENAGHVLPIRNGLAGIVSSGKMGKLTTRTTGGGVAIVAGQRRQLGPLDKGFVFHPVFVSKRRARAIKAAGHKVPRVRQSVTPGWFTKPMEAGAPLARAEVMKAIEEVARQTARRIGN